MADQCVETLKVLAKRDLAQARAYVFDIDRMQRGHNIQEIDDGVTRIHPEVIQKLIERRAELDEIVGGITMPSAPPAANDTQYGLN